MHKLGSSSFSSKVLECYLLKKNEENTLKIIPSHIRNGTQKQNIFIFHSAMDSPSARYLLDESEFSFTIFLLDTLLLDVFPYRLDEFITFSFSRLIFCSYSLWVSLIFLRVLISEDFRVFFLHFWSFPTQDMTPKAWMSCSHV